MGLFSNRNEIHASHKSKFMFVHYLLIFNPESALLLLSRGATAITLSLFSPVRGNVQPLQDQF